MKYKFRKDTILKDKKSVFIEGNVVIGKNVTIYENNRIEGNTVIGDNCVILPNCYIIDSVIGADSVINHSQLEQAIVAEDCKIGPFARLRPKADIRKGAQIGDFVEVKNAVVGAGTKANHLAYIGDADVGENCNVGCGAIFVNYNGRSKSRTKVGNNCFIGSNCNVIAPVEIEDDSYICAGTTITEKVNSDDFVIGRARQTNKPGRAHEYLKQK